MGCHQTKMHLKDEVPRHIVPPSPDKLPVGIQSNRTSLDLTSTNLERMMAQYNLSEECKELFEQHWLDTSQQMTIFSDKQKKERHAFTIRMRKDQKLQQSFKDGIQLDFDACDVDKDSTHNLKECTIFLRMMHDRAQQR